MENLYQKYEIPEHLQKYFCPAEIGLEETPEAYIEKMVAVFREVRRVLKDDGTLWLNLGDSYASDGLKRNSVKIGSGIQAHQRAVNNDYEKATASRGARYYKNINLKQKDLIGIPWLVAFVLRSDGWYLRQDIIWAKPNPMPESVTDRCTKSHEYIFLLSKSRGYYYDAEAIKMPVKDDIEYKTPDGWDTGKGSHGSFHKEGREKGQKGYEHRGPGDKKLTGHSGNFDSEGNLIGDGKANKRSVWFVPTMPFSEAHFATFPEKLIVDCIKAGCPENGIVLDPFFGSGTTGLVARKLNRNYIGIELNPEYVKLSERRIFNEIGLFV